MNKINLTGTIFREIHSREVGEKKTPNVFFTLSTRNNYRNSDGKYGYTFLPCVAWGNTALFIQKHFKAGQAVEISGHLTSDIYEKDGEKMNSVRVRIDEIGFIPRSFEETTGEDQAESMSNEEPILDITNDDLPF